MKICPTCHISYDDSLKFCLNDGSELLLQPDTLPDTPTMVLGEQETIVAHRSAQSHSFQDSQYSGGQQPPGQTFQTVAPAASGRNSNVLLAVVLTAMIMLLAFGGVALFFVFGRQDKTLVQQNSNAGIPVSSPTPSSSPSAANAMKPSPTSPQASNTNANPVNSSRTAQPNFSADQIGTEVSGRIDTWKSRLEARDLNSFMENYADTVNYYRAKNASRDFVRNDKKRAFSLYDTIRIDITNVHVTPGADGESATAIIDKGWDFTAPGKSSSGKVQQEIQFIRQNGRWLISGERDIKVYFKNK